MPMKPVALLDVNVLLALLWSHHADHERVVRWHEEWTPKKWAVCPFSEAGFLRLSLNPAFVAGQAPVGTLIEILRRLHSKRGYHRMESVPDPSDARFSSLWEKVRGHRQVTDAVLLCMAIDEDVRLATMDRSIAALADRPDRVVLID
jgi:toxin-antitoxin system PIN domain toxin